MIYEIREHPLLPGSWEITASGSNGEVYITLFGGTNAKARAEEYAKWKAEGYPCDELY